MKRLLTIPTLFIIACICMAAVTAVLYQSLPPELPLFYSRPVANGQVVPVYYLYMLPIVMVALIFVNNTVVSRYIASESIMQTMLRVANAVIIIGVTIIYIRIMLLVT